MNNINAKSVPPTLVFLVFFVCLFMFFTPFEQSGPSRSMLPKYLVAGIAIALLLPLFALTKIAFKTASALVFIAMIAILLHAMVINPTPGQFVLLIFANIFLAVVLYELSFTWRRQFVSAVSWLLYLHAAVIALQAALFYVFHDMVDFHKMLYGSDSRFVEDYLNIARFSGLQVEPGTYANYIACLMAILLLTSEFNARVFWTASIALVSIFLTNSGSSVYFVPVMLTMLAYLGKKRIKLKHVVWLALAIAVYLFFSGILAHLETRFFQQDDGSLSHRVDGVNAYMSTTWEEKFAGIGFGADPCVRCYYQDIGATFNLLTRGGVLVAMALALLLFRAIAVHGLVLATILFLIPLNEKMFFYEAPLWLFILFATTALRNARPARKRQADLRQYPPEPGQLIGFGQAHAAARQS